MTNEISISSQSEQVAIAITDEWQKAADVHGVTIERLITDRLNQLAEQAVNLVESEYKAKVASLSEIKKEEIEILRKQNDEEVQAAIDAAVEAEK